MSLGVVGPVVAASAETARMGIYMAIARDLNRADAHATLEIWAQELTRKFQVPSEMLFYTDVKAMRRDFDAGRINLVVADAMTFVRHFRRGELTDGFAAKLATDASLLLIAKAGGASLDLAGKRIAQIANDDISTTYLDTLCLRHQGKNCQDVQVTRVPVNNNHQALTRMLFGQADLALVNRHGFELAKELNPQLARVGQVVSELRFNTQYFGFFSAQVDPVFRALALRTIPSTNSDIRGRQMLDVFKVEQIMLAEPSALQAFYDLESEHLALLAKVRRKGSSK